MVTNTDVVLAKVSLLESLEGGEKLARFPFVGEQ